MRLNSSFLKDKSIFNFLISKYQMRLYKLIQKYIDNPAEAWDVMQESFLKAYLALGDFRGESRFYTWLYRIAVNTAKNHLLLNQKLKIGHAKVLNETCQDEFENFFKDIANPENLLLKEELEQTLYTALSELPQNLKVAFILRTLQGRSYEDISKIMHCPVGTVRSRIFRAKESLQEVCYQTRL